MAYYMASPVDDRGENSKALSTRSLEPVLIWSQDPPPHCTAPVSRSGPGKATFCSGTAARTEVPDPSRECLVLHARSSSAKQSRELAQK